MLETVKDYSQKAAESFIQTAVFIDDRIYQQRGANTGTIDPPPDRPRAIDTVNEANNNSIGAADDAPEDETESNILDCLFDQLLDQFDCCRSAVTMQVPVNNYDIRSRA